MCPCLFAWCSAFHPPVSARLVDGDACSLTLGIPAAGIGTGADKTPNMWGYSHDIAYFTRSRIQFSVRQNLASFDPTATQQRCRASNDLNSLPTASSPSYINSNSVSVLSLSCCCPSPPYDDPTMRSSAMSRRRTPSPRRQCGTTRERRRDDEVTLALIIASSSYPWIYPPYVCARIWLPAPRGIPLLFSSTGDVNNHIGNSL